MSDDDQHRFRNSVPSKADLATNGDAAADANSRVGYSRPPRHARFQPGRSGNPRGRPKGVKSLPDIIRKIVGQKVTVTENGRARRIPRLEAILLRAAGEASRGDPRALRPLLQLTERYGESVQAGADREVTGAEDLAILSDSFGERVASVFAPSRMRRSLSKMSPSACGPSDAHTFGLNLLACATSWTV